MNKPEFREAFKTWWEINHFRYDFSIHGGRFKDYLTLLNNCTAISFGVLDDFFLSYEIDLIEPYWSLRRIMENKKARKVAIDLAVDKFVLKCEKVEID